MELIDKYKFILEIFSFKVGFSRHHFYSLNLMWFKSLPQDDIAYGVGTNAAPQNLSSMLAHTTYGRPSHMFITNRQIELLLLDDFT
jgi:hypothetical protein